MCVDRQSWKEEKTCDKIQGKAFTGERSESENGGFCQILFKQKM